MTDYSDAADMWYENHQEQLAAHADDLEEIAAEAEAEAEEAARERDRWITNAADLLAGHYPGRFTRPELLSAARSLRDALDDRIPAESE